MYYNTHICLLSAHLIFFAAPALNEIWFRRHRHRHGDELSRKTVHILVGCFQGCLAVAAGLVANSAA